MDNFLKYLRGMLMCHRGRQRLSLTNLFRLNKGIYKAYVHIMNKLILMFMCHRGRWRPSGTNVFRFE